MAIKSAAISYPTPYGLRWAVKKLALRRLELAQFLFRNLECFRWIHFSETKIGIYINGNATFAPTRPVHPGGSSVFEHFLGIAPSKSVAYSLDATLSPPVQQEGLASASNLLNLLILPVHQHRKYTLRPKLTTQVTRGFFSGGSKLKKHKVFFAHSSESVAGTISLSFKRIIGWHLFAFQVQANSMN